MDIAAYHPDLALLAFALGAVAAVLARWAPASGADLAALGAAALLAQRGHVPWLVVVGVALVLPGRARRLRLVIGAVVLLLARPDPDLAIGAMVLLGVLVALGPAFHKPQRTTDAGATAVLVGAVVLATMVGAPDTEGSIALGAAVSLPLLVAWYRAWADTPPHVLAPLGALVAVAWNASDAYRGRPAGLPAALVALAALSLVWLLPRWWPVAAAAGAVSLVAARTVGLATDASLPAMAACAGCAGLVVAAGVVSARRAPAHTPPA